MAGGTIALTRTGSGYLTGQIVWSSQSNGSEANTSTVTAQLQLQRSALNTTTGTFKGSFTVGSVSETISWYGSLPSMEWITVKTITATLSHNADGKGSCYLHALINGPTQTTMEGTSVSGAATVALDSIPRFASIVSVTDFTDEGNPVITYANPAGTIVSSLQACISLTGARADVPYRDISKTDTSYTFALTEDERNTLRAAAANSNTLTVYVFIQSQIGGSTLGNFKTATMTVVNAQPELSFTVADTNDATAAITGDRSVLVALHSTALVSMEASAKKYAVIASQSVEHGSAALSGSGQIPVVNAPIKVAVTDSRGNRTEQYAANTIVPYIDPTCVIGDGLPEADGSFALTVTGLFYNGTIGKTENTLTVQYRYKAAGGSYGDWTTFTSVTRDGNAYGASTNLTGLDYRTVYTFQARAMDAVYTAGVWSGEKAVIAEPVFHWGQRDFTFNVPVNLKNGCDILKNGAPAFAPFGYGLGIGCVTVDSVKNIPQNGWYLTQGDVPLGGVWFCHSKHSVDNYNIVVDAYSADGKLHARITKNGVWGEWEWINPPLNAGVEYRTTERWYSYPVYIKLIDVGALPNNGTKQVQVFENAAGGRVIEAYGFENLSGQKIPTMRFGGNWNHNAELPFSGRFLNVNTNFDGSAFTQALITVKYIKY